jgi:hypothetical protein
LQRWASLAAVQEAQHVPLAGSHWDQPQLVFWLACVHEAKQVTVAGSQA